MKSLPTNSTCANMQEGECLVDTRCKLGIFPDKKCRDCVRDRTALKLFTFELDLSHIIPPSYLEFLSLMT